METPTIEYKKVQTEERQTAKQANKGYIKHRWQAHIFLRMKRLMSALESTMDHEAKWGIDELEKKEYAQLQADIKEYEQAGVLRRIIMPFWQGAAMGVGLFLCVELVLSVIFDKSTWLHTLFTNMIFQVSIATESILLSTIGNFWIRDERMGRKKRHVLEYELSHGQKKVEEDLFKNSINMSYTYLNEYYAQTREQAKSGFFVTVSVAVFGAILIFIGVLLLLFGDNEKITPAYITCASGVITEFISSIFFALYNKTVTSMNSYHDKLVLSQNVAFALRIAGEIDGMGEKNKAKLAIINELVKDVNAQMMKSDGDADEPPKKDKPSASDAETPS